MATEKRLVDANAKFIEKHFAKRLIDIYALIDVIENTDWYHINPQGKLVDGANSQENIPLYKASDIHRALANATAVDAVEVVHGRWENPYMNGYGHPCHCCSVCGFKASYQDKNYCPNCGAKMDLE